MVNIKKIEQFMKSRNISRTELAGILGITRKTLDRRFDKQVLLDKECDILIKLFDIQNPVQIFFVDKLRNK